jgi:hypothetical protein
MSGESLKGRGNYQILGSTTDLIFDRSSGIGHPIARLNAFASRFNCQSPRAICSALNTQSSLDGIPHRTQRSQSPQVKSGAPRKDRSAVASLFGSSRTTVPARMSFSYVPFYEIWLHSRGRVALTKINPLQAAGRASWR